MGAGLRERGGPRCAGLCEDYASEGLGLGYVVSAILPGNAATRRVAERAAARADGRMEAAGMVFERWVWG